MLLATGPTFEFIKFIQILCWIVLPVSLIAILLTIIFHYRKKKKEKADIQDNEEEFIPGSPEELGYTKGDGEYVFFDHSALISDYKKKLSYNHARYTALRHDFEKMEMKYEDLAVYTTKIFTNNKIAVMENTYEQMPSQLQEEITKLSAGYKAEKEELLARFDQMNRSYKSLQEENQFLQDQVNMQTATEDERAVIINRWKADTFKLKEKIAEQQYLQDVLEEKKVQIEFLQNQLENRIKNSYQSEQQRMQVVAGLEEEKALHTETFKTAESLKNELLQRQEEADKLQMVLCGKEEQLLEKQQLLASKMDHIAWLENALHESKEQNDLVAVSLADSKGLIASLQEQLANEQARTQLMEQKLSANKQTMQRLYIDFASFMDEENAQSPVIALRPEYINRENEEIAAVHE